MWKKSVIGVAETINYSWVYYLFIALVQEYNCLIVVRNISNFKLYKIYLSLNVISIL